ncbi:MAG: hypothetical protein M3290_13830 [Actinomycetota bacterium]|nr:hypothetical protein [Actinomycetota bacterium]
MTEPRDRSIDAPDPALTDEEPVVEDDDDASATVPSREKTALPRRLPIDAPEGDAIEQAIPADLDEEW